MCDVAELNGGCFVTVPAKCIYTMKLLSASILPASSFSKGLVYRKIVKPEQNGCFSIKIKQ